jgi:uncharacterized RDD family membrane protein YckC
MSSATIKYSTFWRRFIAGFIDGLVLMPITWIDSFVSSSNLSTHLIVEWAIISHSAAWVYNVLMHGYYGQTIGKMISKVKVVDVSESPISMRQAFLRDSVYAGLSTIALILFLYQKFFSGDVESPVIKSLTNLLGLTGFIWFLVEIVTMLTNEKRRALHDFIAGPVVVRSELIDERPVTLQAQSGYVKLEVRGTLLNRNNLHYIRTDEANFPNVGPLVRLERGEDKNHDLDRYLELLEGKVVVISGFLDRGKTTREEGIIDLHLNSMSQIKVAE